MTDKAKKVEREETPSLKRETRPFSLGTDKFNFIKEEVKLLVGEVETQRSFIDNLRHRLKTLEMSKYRMEEKNQFLQKNVQRLIKEKVTLLQEIEEMRQSASMENMEEPEEADTKAISRGNIPSSEESPPARLAFGPFSLPLSEKWVDNIQEFWESVKAKLVREFLELETRFRKSQERVTTLEEKLLETEQEKGELVQFLEKMRESYAKLTGEMTALWNSHSEYFLPEKLHPPLQQEKDFTSPPPSGGDSFSVEENADVSGELPSSTQGFYFPLYREFLKFLFKNQKQLVLPEASPEAAIGYIYSDVVTWGGIARGEEASFLEEGVKQGYFTKQLVNKVHLCPQCFRYNLNFRTTCPHCLGIDFDSSHFCRNCDKEFSQPRSLCQCLNCQCSFAIDKAIRCNLYQYEVTSKGEELASFSFQRDRK